MTRGGRRRILFVSYTSEWTGPTRSLLLLLPYVRERFEVGVLRIGEGPLAGELSKMGVPHWSFERLDKWSIPRVARLVRGEGVDLVYANATHGSARNAFLAAKLTRSAFVCHVRAMAWDASWRRLGYLRWADGVVAVSEACAASVARFVPTDRLHVVYNGIPDSFGEDVFVDARREVRKELGLVPDDVLILSAAHLNERKGQLHAVRALRILAGRFPEARLCLAGRLDREPEYVGRVRQCVAREQLGERVRLAGFREDIERLMAASEIFLHTALDDPHPRAVLEAMASGLPVVAFGVDGVAETVLDGTTGRLVPAGDDEALASALTGLLDTPGERERMGAAGRRRVEERFSERTTGEAVSRILEQILCGTESAVD